MNKKNIITYLIIFNLLAILIILISKISIIKELINIIFSVVIIPIIFGVFLFYILKPINNILLKRKIKSGTAALTTIIIFIGFLIILFTIFGDFILEQFLNIKSLLLDMTNSKNNIDSIKNSINKEIFSLKYYDNILANMQNYIFLLVNNIKRFFNGSIQLFSNVILVILITFYLLKEEEKLKDYFVKIFPGKYMNKIYLTLDECDDVLQSYILGQTKIALLLSIVMYIGYKFIGILNPLLLAFSTFILAFIPFIGFFISLILPFILAISLGFNIVLKLSILAFIVQVIKGRIIVPLIMGKTMKIHPITDIFLVVGAATLIGPIGAFIIIPIYSIIKIVYINFKQEIDRKLKEFKK
ncbi:MAG: AI-2E family transporter [Clostridium sp.]|nr:AI-2E family transporter [Clostridium sp.]